MARIPYQTPETDAYTQLAKVLRQRENELVVLRKEMIRLSNRLALATSGVQMALDGTSEDDPAKLAATRMEELISLRTDRRDLARALKHCEDHKPKWRTCIDTAVEMAPAGYREWAGEDGG